LNYIVRNVNEAWDRFIMDMQTESWVKTHCRLVAPRGMRTLEVLNPVIIRYERPQENILFDPLRDCNPFFHMYEALWILAGRDDVLGPAFFSSNIAQFSDDGKTFLGAYGARLRNTVAENDQIAKAVKLLRKDPDSRRAVLGLWKLSDWYMVDKGKDIPCNATAFLSLREGRLNMTVCNRSNDAVWGCFGANAVQWSILLQYIAGQLGCEVGSYTQFSNSLHVYLEGAPGEAWSKVVDGRALFGGVFVDDYSLPRLAPVEEEPMKLVRDPELFDVELNKMMGKGRVLCKNDIIDLDHNFEEPFFKYVVVPMMTAYMLHKNKQTESASGLLKTSREPWLVAARQWLERRLYKGEAQWT